jgi:hypothetical protein
LSFRTILLVGLISVGAAGLVAVTRHAPPFREVSDGAILEIYALQALKGRLLVGPYSRFGWHHPGPLFFYVAAPWYWMSGHHTAGLQAGALAINLAAIAAIAWTAARLASPPIAIAVAVVTAWYTCRTGDLIVSVWNPHVIVLPMLAFVVMAAALAATGRRVLLLWLVLFGSFLVQTHIAMAPLVAVLGATAVVAQRQALDGMWVQSCLAALALWLPPMVEQATHSPGNLTRIVTFFAGGSSSGQTAGAALVAWSASLTSAFTHGFAVARGLDFRPPESSWPVVWTVAQIVVLVAAAVWATRRGDDCASWFATMCVLASAVAFAATMRIRGQIADHEIFWMSALGALNAGAIAGVLATAAGVALDRRRVIVRRIATTACYAAFLVAVAAGAIGMRHVLNRSRTPEDHNVDVLTEDIGRYVSQAHPRRVLFRIEQPVWTLAAGALLRVYKDGVRFAVDDRWTTMFGEAFEANGREDASLTITGSPRAPVLQVTR